ncbi:MAG: hypothetical protein WA459_21555 [Stellaceae bacterium]
MEGLALLGVFVVIVMLVRWLRAHDETPDGKTGGLFAMQEPPDARDETSPTLNNAGAFAIGITGSDHRAKRT